MANFTITVSSTVEPMGSPTDLWNAYNWGSFVWGYGTADLQVLVRKILENTVTPDTDTYRKQTLVLENTLSPTADMYGETLKDGSGYSYIFPSNVLDAESRFTPTYTAGSNPSTSWSTMTATTTSWS